MKKKKSPLKFGGGDGKKNTNDNKKVSKVVEKPESKSKWV